jgi:vacuolar-type H+-ATPase subunit H
VEAVFYVSGRLYLKRGKGGEGMSILEEIKEAERTAAEAKRDTKMTAREMMREAEEAAGKEAEKMLNNARAAAKDTIAAAEEEAKARAKALIEERRLADRSETIAAKAKLPEAVAYIIERVVV